jgi:hypothetical protein
MRNLWLFLTLVSVTAACVTTNTRRKKSRDDDDGGGAGVVTDDDGSGASGAYGGASYTGGGLPTTTVATTGSMSTTAATSTGSGPPPNCYSHPSCGDCFCEQDPNGCNAYLAALVTHIYCGQSCGGVCSAFCSTYDPNQITFACDDCTDYDVSQSDINAFFASCPSGSACGNFLDTISGCP